MIWVAHLCPLKGKWPGRDRRAQFESPCAAHFGSLPCSELLIPTCKSKNYINSSVSEGAAFGDLGRTLWTQGCFPQSLGPQVPGGVSQAALESEACWGGLPTGCVVHLLPASSSTEQTQDSTHQMCPKAHLPTKVPWNQLKGKLVHGRGKFFDSEKITESS